MIKKNIFSKIHNRKKKRRKIITNFKISKIKKKDLASYNKFGKSYFDSKKIGIGYGEYIYDGRFVSSVKRIINFFKLKKNSKVLEIGCAKGFLLVEFFKLGMKTFGIDNSSYAKTNAHLLVKNNIKKFNIEKKFPFRNNFFDFVICKDVLPHITKNKLNLVIKEINRVVKTKSNIFIEIQSFKKKKDKFLFRNWDMTHKSCLNKTEWLKILKNNNYKGYYNIKFLF